MSGFPLYFGEVNKKYIIKNFVGNDDVLKRLIDMGFVKDAEITILGKSKSGVMVRILESKLALDFSLANKIYIVEKNKNNETDNQR